MPYTVLDLEITEPVSPQLDAVAGDGIAVLLRRAGRPVDFFLEDCRSGAPPSPAELARRIDERVARLPPCTEQSSRQRPDVSVPLPSLTIAICTKDRPELLSRCLRSLAALEAPHPGRRPSVEFLVVDNAPGDERTKDVVATLPGARYAREPKPGLDFARNLALAEASGDVLAFLDDDVVVDRYWLVGLISAWVDNPDAGAFTGKVLPFELATDAQILFEKRGGFGSGFARVRYEAHLPGDPYYPCHTGIFGTGANMAFRTRVLRDLGGFDEALDTGRALPAGGDLDVFYRVVRAGHPLVYEPRYLVFHQHRRELEALRRQYWSWGLGFMTVLSKSWHTDPSQRPKLWRLVPHWFRSELRQLFASLRGRHVLPADMILAEIRGGVQGLLGEYRRSQRRTEDIRRRFA